MKRIAQWMMGFAVGAGVAAVLVILFAPVTAEEIRRRLKEGYESTLEEARQAAQQRREELEAQLKEIQRG